MLDATPARTVFQRFHTELFGLDRYATIEKDATLFPKLQRSDERRSCRPPTRMFFDTLFYAQGTGFRDIC